MRELLTYPNSVEFTQGSIFEGLNVNQNDTYTNAIIITARCDIANGKARNILCLPIYKASDWIKNQGDVLVFRRVKNKLLNKIKEELNKFSLDIDILDTYPIDNIIKIIEQNTKIQNKEEIKKYLLMYDSEQCDYSVGFVLSEKKSLIGTLINNNEASIYFLEQIDLNEVLEPYVVDFINPVSIPFDIASKLLSGVKRKNTDELIDQYLTVYKDEISYISCLKSPYIEHLLQKFSTFYSRIGTDDIEKEASDILRNKINEI